MFDSSYDPISLLSLLSSSSWKYFYSSLKLCEYLLIIFISCFSDIYNVNFSSLYSFCIWVSSESQESSAKSEKPSSSTCILAKSKREGRFLSFSSYYFNRSSCSSIWHKSYSTSDSIKAAMSSSFWTSFNISCA